MATTLEFFNEDTTTVAAFTYTNVSEARFDHAARAVTFVGMLGNRPAQRYTICGFRYRMTQDP